MSRVVGKHRATIKRQVVAMHQMIANHRLISALAAVVVVVGAAAAAISIPASPAPVRTVSDSLTASQTGTVRTGSVVRSNVAAAHSPQLERMAAGHPGVAPRASARSLNALATTAPSVQGIDVSSIQHSEGHVINWSSVAAAHYKFAFIKVSEGSYYVNPYYASDAQQAQSATMFAAPYAFAIPNYSGGALQADYALDAADYAPTGRLLAPILDIEYDPYGPTGYNTDGTTGYCYGLSPAQMVAWIGAFTAEIQRRTGQDPVIYSTAQWWNKCTANSTKFSTDPLWIANYGVSKPAMPTGWTNWLYWQYGQSTVSGVSGSTDVSYLSSTALQLAAPANLSDPASSQASLQPNALTAATAVTYSETGLPTGTTFDPASGAVSGTLPATPGTFPAVITASAAGYQTATQPFSWYVHGGVTLASLSGQAGSVAAPVRYQIQAQDGLSGCTLQFSASGLPPGLAINSCGMISGWPAQSGTYSVAVTVKDSSSAPVAQGSISWNVGSASGRGPAGHVVLRTDGKCLAERSPTNIAIETCSRASAERWTFATDGSVRISGKCLTVMSARRTAPAALHLTSCTGAQRWQLQSNAVLRSLTSTKRCLADTGSKNGSRATASVCKATFNKTGSASTPSQSQQWTLPAGPLTSDIAGFCASTQRGGPANTVTLRRCRSSAAQDWTIEPDGALSAGGKCLRTASGTVSPGTLLYLARCAPGAADQVWQLAGGPVGVELVNPAAGLCLADPGDRASAGTLLRIGACMAGDPGISWRVS